MITSTSLITTKFRLQALREAEVYLAQWTLSSISSKSSKSKNNNNINQVQSKEVLLRSTTHSQLQDLKSTRTLPPSAAETLDTLKLWATLQRITRNTLLMKSIKLPSSKEHSLQSTAPTRRTRRVQTLDFHKQEFFILLSKRAQINIRAYLAILRK